MRAKVIPIPETSLWIGNVGDTWDFSQIYANDITAIVDLAGNEPIPKLGRELIYCRFPLVDNAQGDISLVQLAISNVFYLITTSQQTLVYCSNGASRSPTICAAALSLVRGETIEESVSRISSVCCLDISPGLWNQVRTYLQETEKE